MTHPSQIVHVLDRALRIASAERAPVAVLLPRDVQIRTLEFPPNEHGVNYSSLVPLLPPSIVLPPRGMMKVCTRRGMRGCVCCWCIMRESVNASHESASSYVCAYEYGV